MVSNDCLGSCEYDPSTDPNDGVGNAYLHIKANDGKTRHEASEFAVYVDDDGCVFIDIYEGPGCFGVLQKHFEFKGINADRLRSYLGREHRG